MGCCKILMLQNRLLVGHLQRLHLFKSEACTHQVALVPVSLTAKIVAPIDLTENHDVGRGQKRNRIKPGLVLRH